MKVKISVENRTILRVITITLLFVGALVILWFMRKALGLIFLSFFLALAINPPVTYLASKMPNKSRVLGTLITYVLVLGTIITFLILAIPPLISQTIELVDEAPEYIDDIRSKDNFIADFINDYNLADQAKAELSDIGSRLGDLSGPIFSSLNRLSSFVVDTFTVLVMTFFMLVEGPKRIKAFWRMYPEKRRSHDKMLADKMYKVVTSYVNGQLMIAAIAAVWGMFWLYVFNIPYWFPLSVLVGLLGLIPLIGATISIIIVTTIALFQSALAAVGVAIVFIAYQQLENTAIQPYIQSKTMDMSPLLVFVAVIIGITTSGVIGAFIAIPLAGCIRVVTVDYYHGMLAAEEFAKAEKDQKRPTNKKTKKKS